MNQNPTPPLLKQRSKVVNNKNNMAKLSYIIESNDEKKTCHCGSQLWYLTRGVKKYDYSDDRTQYTRHSYYIYTCGECGERTDHTIIITHVMESYV